MIGISEILIIALVIVFFFGGKKLVEWVKHIKEVKKELGKNHSREINSK